MRRGTAVATLAVLVVALMPQAFSFGVASARDTVELTFWYMGWGVKYEAAIKEIIKEFEKEYPYIRVKAEVVPWQAGWYEKFLTAVTGRVAPDVSEGASYQPILFAAMDEILPVDDIIAELERAGRIGDLVSANHRNYYMNGHYWAVPIQVDPRIMGYRSDLFKEAGVSIPGTWDEFLAVTKKLTVDSDGDGRIDRYGFVYPAARGHEPMQVFLSFMLQNGAYTLNKSGEIVFDNPRTVQTLEFLTDLTLKHGVTPPGILGYRLFPECSRFVYDGKAAITVSTDDFIFEAVRNRLPVAAHLGVIPPLRGPSGDTGMAGWTNPIMIYKQTKHPEEAKAFVRFYLRPENLRRLYETGEFHWPAERQFLSLAHYRQHPALADIAGKVLPTIHDYTFPSDATPVIPVIEGELMWADAVQLVLTGKMTPQQAVKYISSKMKEAAEQ